MNKIKVVGLGPGHPDYVLPVAKRAINEADILIGGRRNIESINPKDKEIFIIEKNLKKLIPFIKEKYKTKKVAVIVSGDTGFYSLLRYLKRYIESEYLEVIPGISSLQYMFSKLGHTWDDAFIGSLHGRNLDFVKKVREYKKVGLLTDKNWPPKKIAKKLLDNGIKDRVMYVGERLSYEDERITKGNIEYFTTKEGFGMCVVVITDDKL
ncbi:precorrin-6y C5,15-methyltransferase (decarboxylating) subunit CbiE [Thermohalobacter berrensis]|uniref:Precorrin-6y C5,15-methyltransferase (Decarboxylating) subunit CbiE n=1 Tax=Thermohalobacter berrensis TaxID=99594 RepID=A0A419SZA5_9FIRM|nr:precorrin-6y C5,15-methyltransferase (decarboxylating) subunit CbiE [Thermohalobacter berrensis]RKD30597.1 precorrin-6y C5,15-methyltransferase (decarboxylating) subunit CbiE [Thermohalobacter berrensis]